jgi:hypothetical protein
MVLNSHLLSCARMPWFFVVVEWERFHDVKSEDSKLRRKPGVDEGLKRRKDGELLWLCLEFSFVLDFEFEFRSVVDVGSRRSRNAQ